MPRRRSAGTRAVTIRGPSNSRGVLRFVEGVDGAHREVVAVLNGRRPIVVVCGALANKPGNGGAAWTRLSWPLGLMRLDCDVYFVEQIAAATCVDASGAPCDVDRSVNLAYFKSVTERFGLGGRAALVLEEEQRLGVAVERLVGLAGDADVLVNISGHLTVTR